MKKKSLLKYYDSVRYFTQIYQNSVQILSYSQIRNTKLFTQIRNILNNQTVDIFFKSNIFLYSLTEVMVASGFKVQGFK